MRAKIRARGRVRTKVGLGSASHISPISPLHLPYISQVGHALLPAIIALARAPAPAHWQRIAGSAEALARGEEVEYDYERVVTGTVTGERCRGHPAARAVHDMVHGLKKRAMKCAAGLPTDRWIQFAKPDAQGELQPHEP